MKRILALVLLAGFVLAACGAPIVDKSREGKMDGAEKKAEKMAGGDE